MKIKDWKITIDIKNNVSFKHRKTEDFIDIYLAHDYIRGKWRVDLPTNIFKHFETKPQALKFARTYMRTH